ncbi:MAG: DUF1576 domain-containing protein [Candidatus Faecousia sp.]|nr:DUF1576 domain-containing protein [Clostridiales bacterium]MDD5882469.1 DUF1576 domain-containing protein [Bacillota bacterium]MDY4598431.1 DUF1576 domain-containing protein [Candidatus Faecousia sp.]
MKKIRSMSEGEFLKLFFAFFTAAFLIAAVIMPDRATMLPGLWQILSQPSKLSTNYFAVGGYAATFLNMGLVALISLLLFVVFRGTPTNVSTLAFVLTLGFGSWGINILNIWPTIFGVMIYCIVKKEKFGANVNAMLFSTGIAPLITDLMIRYPNAEAVGFNLEGILIALAVGFCIGFFLPAGLANSPKVHKGFDLYSAALPIGMTAFFLNATLYKTLGVALPAGADAAQLQVASRLTVNTFCLILFGLCVVFAFVLGCRPKDYWNLLIDPALVTNFSSTYGNAVFLMNVGVFGLFILGYYNLIGASFNGVTFGIIFCMLATCNSGSHPGNVWPIMAGYLLASTVCGLVSPLVGGTFTFAINAQAICVGLCYANGLSPIADKYGWRYGILAAVMHYLLVTSVPTLHGGYCLYNGGFTAALICIILVPSLERFSRDKFERKALKNK